MKNKLLLSWLITIFLGFVAFYATQKAVWSLNNVRNCQRKRDELNDGYAHLPHKIFLLEKQLTGDSTDEPDVFMSK